jgi:glutamate 5-kinase
VNVFVSISFISVDTSSLSVFMSSASPEPPVFSDPSSPGSGPLIVIKVGTSTLMKVNPSTGEQRVILANMGALVDTVTTLHRSGYGVIIVTSAAVGFGCLKLKLAERPKNLALKQAVAAAGQSQLIRMYEDLFGVYGVPVAQVLLSRFDFSAKDRFANVHNALRELLRMRVIPIINENDTVSTEELRFGDNDTLSALVAVGVSAKKLFLLTDVDCLYTSNPRTNPNSQPVLDVTAAQLATLGGADSTGGGWGTGGMLTKIIAARTAVCAGIETVLSHGAYPERVVEYLGSSTQSRPPCTVFHAADVKEVHPGSTMTPHRRWVLALPVRGTIVLDNGATKAVAAKSSLLAVGVLEVNGKFLRDEAVSLVSAETGAEIARALMNLDSTEVVKIKGLKSSEYSVALGFQADPEIAYRANIILIAQTPNV